MSPPTSTTSEHGPGSAELARAATVARLFYLDGVTKRDIGRQLAISRFKVARLLDLAREHGLVRIEIDTPRGFDLDLADRLRQRFGLAEVYVTDQPGSDERARLGAAAAPVVADLVADGEVLGVAWGRTLSALIDHLPGMPAGAVVQIAGGAGSAYGDDAADLVRRLAGRYDVETFVLHAPLFVGDPATAAALRADAATATTLDRFGDVTTALLGVGAWPRSGIRHTLSAGDVAALADAGVVAESCGMFLTADGKEVAGDVRARTVAMSPEQLRSVPRRIGVAGGAGKAAALAATLRAGLFTHLITDEAAAAGIVASVASRPTG